MAAFQTILAFVFRDLLGAPFMPIFTAIWNAVLKWVGPNALSIAGKINVQELLQALVTGFTTAVTVGSAAGFGSKAFFLSLVVSELTSVNLNLAHIYTGAFAGFISGVLTFILDIANRQQNAADKVPAAK